MNDYSLSILIAYGAVTLLMSVVAFVLFAKDKVNSTEYRYRIPERALLFTCMLGGWPGGLFAMWLLNHKCNALRKNYFRIALYLAAIFWVITLLFIVFYK